MRNRPGCPLLVALIATAGLSRALAADVPPLAEVDRIRVAEAFRLARSLGDRIWPDWGKAPFAVLLVAGEREILLRHPAPSADFVAAGDDALLDSPVWSRPRQFSPELLATFPAVGGLPTIVIGQAERTAARGSTRWVVTLLHEHFHQLQYSQPGYYDGVDALGLARGDRTGMWMLDYAFPYSAPPVREQFAALCRALAGVLLAQGPTDFAARLAVYLGEKQELRALLGADDYRYFTFQAWQEGIARYTEYHVARLAAADYRPSRAFRALEDFRRFDHDAGDLLAALAGQLGAMRLDQDQRTAFYAVGAAEGLVLDRARPDWRRRYFAEPFSLDPHFAALPARRP